MRCITSLSQPVPAIICELERILTCPCDAGNPLPDGTVAAVVYDVGSDGLDPSDIAILSYAWVVEGQQVPCLGFAPPDSLPPPLRFYVRVEQPGCCWMSNPFILVPGVQEVIIADWTSRSPDCYPTSVADRTSRLPRDLVITSVHPNPFNPTATIEFTLSTTQRMTLRVFDVTGRVVATLADGVYEPGDHRLTFNGTNLATGLYFARLESGANITTAKLLLLK